MMKLKSGASAPTLIKQKKKRHGPTVRQTANVSSHLMEALDERATVEGLPLATVVRRAVVDYVRMSENKSLPEVSIRGLEDANRKGRRGPTAQWPVRVSFVLDADVWGAVEDLARQSNAQARQDGTGEGPDQPSDIVRKAIGLTLARDATPRVATTRLEHGFVTTARPSGAAEAKQAVVDVYAAIRDAG